MSYARYLSAVNSALRDKVLPDLQSGRAQDAVNLCINILGALAAELERPAPEALAAIDAAALPVALKLLVPAQAAPAAGVDAALTLSLATPPQDFALSQDARPLITAGAEWLSASAWPNDPDLSKSATALLNWETALRSDAMARAQRAERGLAALTASAAVPDINQAALEHYLQQRLGSTELRVTEFHFLTGGRTRQTALFTVTGTTAIPARCVVQRDHPGAITTLGGAGMQFQVLEHVHAAGMKVAKPVMMEVNREPLGARFLITAQVSGTSPVPSMDYWAAPLKSDQLAASLARQLALLHQIPIGPMASVLSRSVDTSQGQTWLTHVEALEQQWRGLAHAPSMAISAAFAWMRANIKCVEVRETIVHGDALLHNALAENEELTALLDWEAVRIGHPLEDLGYVRPVIEQMTDWNRFVDAYVAAGGTRATRQQMDFFTLLAILKLMVMVAYARSMFDNGHTNDHIMAEVGASFLPKLIERMATQLHAILS
jgi:aminoglycoside phosphotransferase (APT) family kinase protein